MAEIGPRLMSKLSVSLIIPILNERSSLLELLIAIKNQTHQPKEIIFVDAGSTDGGPKFIKDWWGKEGWLEATCKIISREGAMPGAGRNIGISNSDYDWIAFVDGGIIPATDWLDNLCLYATASGRKAIFGTCDFSAEATIARAVCALSYGVDASHSVLPASLFNKQIFEEVGGFREDLRAGEDLVWMNSLKSYQGKLDVCSKARVKYTHFPSTWTQAFRKWKIVETHCVHGGVRVKQHVTYIFGLPIVYIAVIFGGKVGANIFLIYLIFRGVLDPIRRSGKWNWWKGNVPSAILALPIAASLDFAKWLGIVTGYSQKILKKLHRK